MIDNLTEAIAHERNEAERFTITSNALYEEFYEVSLRCQECADKHTQIADWLTELQERRKADRWISVKERLPEDETDVLVCNAKGDMIVCRGSRSTEIEGEFIWYVCDWRYGNVTHWKPLPKAPESEAENLDYQRAVEDTEYCERHEPTYNPDDGSM